MSTKFGISNAHYALIQTILSRYLPPPTRVWVFGSRATGRAHTTSDLDLALDTETLIPPRILSDIRDTLQDAPLPFTVDIVDMGTLSDEFKAMISTQKVAF